LTGRNVWLSNLLISSCYYYYYYVFEYEGVFVTVTMAVSTISVIESVIVIRLCSPQTTVSPLPSVVRFVAFRLVGRVLCVSGTSNKVSPIPSRRRMTLPGHRSSRPNVKDSSVTSETVKHNSAVDDLVAEFRKVSSS